MADQVTLRARHAVVEDTRPWSALFRVTGDQLWNHQLGCTAEAVSQMTLALARSIDAQPELHTGDIFGLLAAATASLCNGGAVELVTTKAKLVELAGRPDGRPKSDTPLVACRQNFEAAHQVLQFLDSITSPLDTTAPRVRPAILGAAAEAVADIGERTGMRRGIWPIDISLSLVVLASVHLQQEHRSRLASFWASGGFGQRHREAAERYWATLAPVAPPPQAVQVPAPVLPPGGAPDAPGAAGAGGPRAPLLPPEGGPGMACDCSDPNCAICADTCGDEDARCARKAIRARINALRAEVQRLRAEMDVLDERVKANPENLTKGEIERKREVLLKVLSEHLDTVKMLEGEWAKTFAPPKSKAVAKEQKPKEEKKEQPQGKDRIDEAAFDRVIGLARAAAYIHAYGERAIEVAAQCIAEVGRAHGFVFADERKAQNTFAATIHNIIKMYLTAVYHQDQATKDNAWRSIEAIRAAVVPPLFNGSSITVEDLKRLVELKILIKQGAPWSEDDTKEFVQKYPVAQANYDVINNHVIDRNRNFANLTEGEKKDRFTSAWNGLLDSSSDPAQTLRGLDIINWAVKRVNASLDAIHRSFEKDDLRSLARSMTLSAKETEVLKDYLPSKAAVAREVLNDKDIRARVKAAIETLRKNSADAAHMFIDVQRNARSTGDMSAAFALIGVFGGSASLYDADVILKAVETGMRLDRMAEKMTRENERDLSDLGRRWFDDVRRATDAYLTRASDVPVSVALMRQIVNLFSAFRDQQNSINVTIDTVRRTIAAEGQQYSGFVTELESAHRNLLDKVGQIISEVQKLVPINGDTPGLNAVQIGSDRVGDYVTAVGSEAAGAIAFASAAAKAMSQQDTALSTSVRTALRAVVDEYARQTASADKRKLEEQREALRASRALIMGLGGTLLGLANRSEAIRTSFGGPDLLREEVPFGSFEEGKLARIGSTTDTAARYVMALAANFICKKAGQNGEAFKDALKGIDGTAFDATKEKMDYGGIATFLRGKDLQGVLVYARSLLEAWDRFMALLLRAIDAGMDRKAVSWQSVNEDMKMADYIATDADGNQGVNELVNNMMVIRDGAMLPGLFVVNSLLEEEKEIAEETARAFHALWDLIGVYYSKSPTSSFVRIDQVSETYAIRRQYDLSIMRAMYTEEVRPREVEAKVFKDMPRVRQLPGPVPEPDGLTKDARDGFVRAVREAVLRVLPLVNRMAGEDGITVSMVMNTMDTAAKDLRAALKEESKRGTERSKKLLEATARYCAGRLQEIQGRLLVAARDFGAPRSISYHMHSVAMLMDESFAAKISEFGDPEVSAVSKVLRGAFQDEFKNFLVGADDMTIGREALRRRRGERDERMVQVTNASDLVRKLTEYIEELLKRNAQEGKANGEDAGAGNMSAQTDALKKIVEFIASVVACIGDDRISMVNTDLFRVVDGQVSLEVRESVERKDGAVESAEDVAERSRRYEITRSVLEGAGDGPDALWRAFSAIAIMRLHGATKQALEYLASVGRYAAKHGRVETIAVKDPRLFGTDPRRTNHAEIFFRALSRESSRIILGQFVGIQVRIDTRQRVVRKTETRIVDDVRRLAAIERGYARSAIEWYLDQRTWRDALPAPRDG